jgi:putative nucleotidyltransferase with HDIG domain
VKKTARDYRRLRFTLEAVTDLSLHAVEAREFASAARSLLYLLLGSVGAPRGLLFGCDAGGRIYALASKGVRDAGLQAEVSRPLAVTALELAELAACHELLDSRDKRLPRALREVLRRASASWVLPLVIRGRLTGALAIGERLNREPLSAHERGALETLGRYAAVLLHQNDLLRQLRSAVDENLRLCETLAGAYFDTVRAFSAAIDAKDVYTRGHSVRVARYSAGLAQCVGLPRRTVAGIRIGAYLHDIGKLVLERALLNKSGSLTAEERVEVASHPVVGFDVLSSVRFPWPEVQTVVRSHHERLDGRGYPDGLRGEGIPLPARVLAVADAFDAMTSRRPYREPLPLDAALGELVRCAGQQFDPTLVRVFLEECRAEIAPGAEPTRNGAKERPRKKTVRMFGSLLERAGNELSVSLMDSLLKKLGRTPDLQFA